MAKPRICSIDGCDKAHYGRGFCQAHWYRWHHYGDPLAGGTPWGAAQRFFQDVVLPYEGDACLIWPFSRRTKGYGQINLDGRPEAVHRLVCEHAHGPPPTPEHESAHSCGRGHDGCVAKRHLRWATPAENQADRLVHGTHNRGERCGISKLTESDVRAIRALNGKMPQRDIGAAFGIGQQSVSDIIRRKNWAWLD